MLTGDVDGGKLTLRDYIKATVGFEKLGADTSSSPNSLIRCSVAVTTHARVTCSASSAISSIMLASRCM